MRRVAAIQMASGPNVSANLTEAGRLISRAVDAGVGLVVLPENFAQMGMNEQDKLKIQETPGVGPIQSFLAETASKHNVWLVAGTIPMQSDDPARIRAATLVYDDSGEVKARYDKIHLFDVHLEENGETYEESATIQAGNEVIVLDSPFGRLGLVVCYDLRFPELFRRMLNDQVDVFVMPSAFTAMTGKAHWETLVRARAIENLSYMVAAAQGGYHVNGRETFGHSMIVDPWGTVLDQLPSGSGYVTAELDLEKIRNTRRNFPTLNHRKIPCHIKQ